MPIFSEAFAPTHLLFLEIALDLGQPVVHPPIVPPACVQAAVIILEIIIFLALLLGPNLLRIIILSLDLLHQLKS